MIARCVCGAVEYRPLNASSMTVACERRKVERPWAHNLLKILGSEVPRSTAVLCTDSLVAARPRGTKVRREVVLMRVLNSLSLGGNKDF